jgi:GrpB-like predicted nucleotidyltransferase (UPF0157 family)/threonine/homoserine/homoserine lactone efflux protein
MKIFKNGLLTGLALQLAIGPVLFYIINLTLQKTTLDGLVAVIGVTLADYVYITLAILGIGELLKKEKIKKIFGIISSIVLILFGVFIIKNILDVNISSSVDVNSISLFSSFISTFILTISSPLTIVLFTSLFASKVIEYNYTKRELFIFGISTGLATFIFMGCSVILFSLVKGSIPIILIQIMNLVVGVLLIGYGILRLIKILSEKNKKNIGKFSTYNPEWSKKFESEALKIRGILGNQILEIQHIGSTSIPNLSAKPIIDIGVLVNSIDDIQSFVSKLSTLGYDYKPDMSSVERIFLRKGNPIEYHLSVACPKHLFWDRNITFRDYLRTHPELVKEYQNLKIQNLSETPESDFDDLSRSKIYNKGKGDFVQKVLDLAKAE